MKISNLIAKIEEILPKATAIEGDRIGLQVQSGRRDVSNLLVTMELTDEVVEEAHQIGANCIISFHPLIYRPLTEIVEIERVGRLVSKLIKHEIAFISVHTTFDAHAEGTSKIIADKLGLKFIDFLVPNRNIPNTGIGVICEPNSQINAMELVSLVSEKMYAPVKYTLGNESEIKRIGIVGGSGSSFLNEALSANLDAFITADISYHTFHTVRGRLTLIDPGHYEMEQFVSLGIAQLIRKSLEDEPIQINLSAVLTNPVEYYPDNKWRNYQSDYLKNVQINWNKK